MSLRKYALVMLSASLLFTTAIFFLLEKLGAVIGTTNLHIYAAMRGQTAIDAPMNREAP